MDELTKVCPDNVTLKALDAHINDDAFVDTVLATFDDWLARGIVPRP